MSEEDTANNDEAEDAVFDEEADKAVAGPQPAVVRKKGSGIVAWLALLVSIVALAGLGLDYFRDRDAMDVALQSDADLQTVGGFHLKYVDLAM